MWILSFPAFFFKTNVAQSFVCLLLRRHVNSPNLIENDHISCFYYKVSTQQHFEPRLFWKNAEKLRIHTRLASLVEVYSLTDKNCVRILLHFCTTSTESLYRLFCSIRRPTFFHISVRRCVFRVFCVPSHLARPRSLFPFYLSILTYKQFKFVQWHISSLNLCTLLK